MNLRAHWQELMAVFTLTAVPGLLQAQVTHGQKPNLPPPYATKSAGNGPRKIEAKLCFF